MIRNNHCVKLYEALLSLCIAETEAIEVDGEVIFHGFILASATILRMG